MLCDNDQQGRILLQIARASIARALHVPCAAVAVEENRSWLCKPGATFVTLTQYGELRGCAGSLKADDSLLEDVRNNAVLAALHDSRFLPLMKDELDTIKVEVSLLSQLQSLNFTSEADALAQLRPNVDGIVLEYELYRSTFLPQVWEDLPEPQQFLAKLKLKARLSEDFWSEQIRLSRYTVRKWREIDNFKECVHG
ncbi:MAG: AmmeMemoRadiSam system protein A [Nitrosomonas ureae]